MVCSNCSIVRWWKRRVLEGRKNLSIVVFPSLPFSSLPPPSSFSLSPLPFSLSPLPFSLFFTFLPFPFCFSYLQPFSSSLHRPIFSTTSGDRSLGGSTRDGSPWRPQILSLTFLVLFVPQAWWPFLELLVSEYIHQSACTHFLHWNMRLFCELV